MIIKIKNGKIVFPDRIEEKNLYLKDDKIFAVTNEDIKFDSEFDAQGNYVSPGFIDLHTHGGGGSDFYDGGTQPIINAAKLHLKHGTTSIYPTQLSATFDGMKEFLSSMREVMKEMPQIIGAHLEGPYFSEKQCGAQPPGLLTPPVEKEYQYIISEYGDILKRWSYAPELPGGDKFLCALMNAGIVAAAAHSDAIYEQLKPAIDGGITIITHLYSGMSTITRDKGFRRLGVVETALLEDVAVELIADGRHMPPELLKLVFKVKRADKVCLVTDSMRAAGMPEGESILGRLSDGVPCIVEDGVAKMPDRSGFGGSVATADRLLRTVVKQADVPITDAVRTLTKTPATLMGLAKKGVIDEGNDADIIIFDDNIEIKHVFLGGKEVK